ncbi:MAG TPA: PASTA domain-containing protein [Streptosporangiaceae bacterium]|nr:PASTA domain-containing protein [Streptosporangiaceae bacterium]
MDTTLARMPIGQLLDGRYRVESHLAHGGMATVYLGTDTRLDRTVALKIMHAELANDEDFVRRFVAEARSVAKLSHPNVVTVYDQGADGRTLYLAMEYVPGRTLRDLLRERTRLRPREALDIIEGVLSGLAAAHSAGIAHRDVKPENVLLGPAQSLKVADFGLARLLSDVTHTKSGLLIGTAAYLAPEQVAGGRADFRTDVYAAGIMLFELLTGRQPFTGDTPLAVAYRHVNEVVPAPSSLVPALPPALDSLVALATSRDPDLRPADAGQFLRAITGTRHGLPLDVPPPAPYAAGAADAGLPGAGLPGAGLPGASAGLAGAPTVAGLGVTHGAPGPDASIADTAPPQAAAPPQPVVAPVWPGPPPTGWPAQPPWASSGASSSGTPSGGWPQTPATGWPDPPQNGNDLDMIPGMPTDTAVQPYGGSSAGPYRPATNQTLIVSTADAPYGTTVRESRLGRLLFSRRLAYIAAGLAVVLVFGLLGWWMFEGRYTIVPKVTGVSAATAQADLHDVGLTPGSTTTVLDNGVAKGLVIRTSPANGSRIARGGRVDLVVSAGPHMINMPQVTGQPLTDAQAAIKHAGLVPGKVKTVTSTTIAAGIVISTDPTAGTSWPQPKPVSIVLSAGPPLPDFVGQDKAVAEQWAAANGVKLNEVTASHSDQPVNTVVKQSAPPGSAFTNGEVITIQISPGPPMVNIPDVTGLRVPKAVQILRNAGFLVQINAIGPFNVVFSESPTGQAPKGSTITLTTGFPHPG